MWIKIRLCLWCGSGSGFFHSDADLDPASHADSHTGPQHCYKRFYIFCRNASFWATESKCFSTHWYSSALNGEKKMTKFVEVVFLTCSAKFGRKVQYVNQLRELSLHMDLERLPIPKEVIEYVSDLWSWRSSCSTIKRDTGLQIRPVFGSCSA